MLFFDILLGKLERTISTLTVNVPSDQIPVQSETIERYTGAPVTDINEIKLLSETAWIPRRFNIFIVSVTIKGIRGAVIQSSFLIKSSYKAKPITAINGIDTGRTSDRKFRKANSSTPTPDKKRENSPIEYGGFVMPRGILIKLKTHIATPMAIIILCRLTENWPVFFPARYKITRQDRTHMPKASISI